MSPNDRPSAAPSSALWGMSAIRLPCRSNKGTPNQASSPRIWWLTADWVTQSSLAARLKLPCRATASNVRSAPSGA